MPRPEKPIDPVWPLASFACGLRALRQKRGITYREMACLAHYAMNTLSAAADGQHLPTLEVTLAYVRACEGSQEEWERRWLESWDLLRSGNGRDHG
jgi:transcriptional regulator with XRE-family HTH domain